MDLQKRIALMAEVGNYMVSDAASWQTTKEKAFHTNAWFTPEFIDLACRNISTWFLTRDKLENWVKSYHFPASNPSPKNIGLVMAGNIPLVGFHDFLSIFIAGHRQTIKASSKDLVLIEQLVKHLYELDASAKDRIAFAPLLKGCDAYIATGSSNSARYFDYYFGKYPAIIRRNRTSVAVLTGNESPEDLKKLAADVFTYFGLGCRNVTKIFVPLAYDFVPLLDIFKQFDHLSVHNKYKNNYDYQLAIMILNKTYYMTNGSILLTQNALPFSPISVLHYEYYLEKVKLMEDLRNDNNIQCIAGQEGIGFGETQLPALEDYADGIDTLQFLHDLRTE